MLGPTNGPNSNSIVQIFIFRKEDENSVLAFTRLHHGWWYVLDDEEVMWDVGEFWIKELWALF